MPSSSSSSAPNSRVRALRVWSTKDYALAAFIFLVLFSLLLLSHFDPSANPSHSTTTTLVPFTLLRHTRALCLDGSAPAYHFHKGFGSGSRNWLIHTEGGCSAGGLATLIHCDNFRQLLPKEATVKCLADAGFFLDEMDISGNRTMGSFYHDVVQLQGLAESLHKDCITKMEPSKCLFPSEIVKNMKTPLFLVHPAYDFWQIRNILVPQGSDPEGHWQNCRLNIRNCNANMMDKLDSFRGSLLKAVNEFQHRKEIGMFINSCFIHCQTEMEFTWHSPNSPKINDKTIAESVGDWYFDREVVKRIDCSSYSCNPTCHNLDFT